MSGENILNITNKIEKEKENDDVKLLHENQANNNSNNQISKVRIGFDTPLSQEICFSQSEYQLVTCSMLIIKLFKLVEVVLNLLCVILTLTTIKDKYIRLFLTIVYSWGFSTSGFYFILYSFNLINRSNKTTLKTDFIYCSVWELLILSCIIIIPFSILEDYKVDYSTLFTTTIFLLLIYLIECYIKYNEWSKHVPNWQRVPNTPLSVVSDQTPISPNSLPNKNIGCKMRIESFTNSLLNFFSTSTTYFKSFESKLKLAVMIFDILSFILLNTHLSRGIFFLSVSLTSLTGFSISGLLTIFDIFNLIARNQKRWLVECLYSILWAILLFVDFIILCGNNTGIIISFALLFVSFACATYIVEGSIKMQRYLLNKSRKEEFDESIGENRKPTLH